MSSGVPEFNPLTPQGELVAAEFMQGKKPFEIAQDLGMDTKEVKRELRKPETRAFLAAYLDAAGATIEKTAQRISEALDAEETKFFAYEGEIVSERSVVDHGMRLKAAELTLRARGELKDGVNVNFNKFMSVSDEDLARIASGELDPAALQPGPRGELAAPEEKPLGP